MTQDRRAFLQDAGTLAATAAMTLPAARPVAAKGKTSANETIVCGVIGVGGRGRFLLRLAATVNGVVVHSLCDVNQRNLTSAVQTAQKAGIGQVQPVHDFRRILDDRSIDAVIIATPHHWHTPIAVRALEAGKHIYVEKPASHVFREGRILVDAAKRNRCVVQHGTQMRSSEVTAEAAKVLASGILGEIKMAKAWGVEPRSHYPGPVPDRTPPDYLDYSMWLGPAPERPFNPNRFRRWNNFRDYGNGEIGGDGIHDIDLARWGLGVTGHPIRVVAHGSRIHIRGETDFPDNMMVAYQYPNDKVLIYENRNFAPYRMHGWDNGNIFYGTKGYMIFSRRGYFQTYLGAKEEKGPGMRGGAGNEEHVRNFFECIRNGKAPAADAETAHLSCALVHLGEIAFRAGRVIHFDPATEQIRGDAEANAMLTKPYRTPWGFEGTG